MVRVLGRLDIFNFVCGCCLNIITEGHPLQGNNFPLTQRALVNTTKDQIYFTCSTERKVPFAQEVRERLSESEIA